MTRNLETMKEVCEVCTVAGRCCGGKAVNCAVTGCSACKGSTWRDTAEEVDGPEEFKQALEQEVKKDE